MAVASPPVPISPSDSPTGGDPYSTRVDFGRLDGRNIERTPQGGIRVPAFLTRTGVFEYQNADGSSRKEYRPADEVFKADSLKTLSDAPVTEGHPGMVDSSNYTKLSRGQVRDIKQDGNHVAGFAVIQDASLVAAIESGALREVSCGYRCREDNTPGIFEGQAYDLIQRDIVYNHVALVPKGRAGSTVALKLDAQGVQKREVILEIEKFDGVDYEKGSAALLKAQHVAKDLETANEALKVQTARADKAEGELAGVKADLATANDPKRLDEAIKARVALETDARKVLGTDAKFDGKSENEIKREVAAKAYPEIKLDEKSSTEMVDGLYTAALAKPKADGAGVNDVRSIATGPKEVSVNTLAGEAFVPEWSKPLAMTAPGK